MTILQPPIPTVTPTPTKLPSSYASYPGAIYIDPETNKPTKAIPLRFADAKSYVAKSPIQGLGCFAKTNLSAGEIIEECSAILLDTTVKHNKDWVITQYLFTWPCEHEDPVCKEHGPTYFVPTGNALLYNHADAPNSYWIYDKSMKRLLLGALRDIKENEELTWYYGHGYAQKLRSSPTASGGCSSCEKKRKELEEKRNQEQSKDTSKTSNNVIEEVKNLQGNIEFRSMVVPENKINDTIQDGSL